MINPHLVLIASLLPIVCLADTTLVFEADAPSEDSTRLQVKDGRVLLGTNDPSAAMLYDSAAQTLTMISHQDREYIVMDQGTMDNIQTQMSAAMKQMEERLASLPPEQREMVRKMMPGMGAADKKGPEISVRKSGQNDEIAGISCSKAVIITDGEPTKKVCVASRAALGIAESDFSAITSMFEVMTKMATRLSSNPVEHFPDLGEMQGFPVYTRSMDDSNVSRLQSVDTGALDASLFEIEADYTQQEIPLPGPR